MAQAGVAEFAVLIGRFHQHAQVDVTLAHLEQIDAGIQEARDGVLPAARDHDVRGIFDQWLGIEPRRTGTQAHHPEGAKKR